MALVMTRMRSILAERLPELLADFDQLAESSGVRATTKAAEGARDLVTAIAELESMVFEPVPRKANAS